MKEIENDRAKIIVIITLKNENLLIDSISKIKNEATKTEILTKITDDKLKYKLLYLLPTIEQKVDVVSSMSDNNIKIKFISSLETDKLKLRIISRIKDEKTKVSLLDTLEEGENKFLIVEKLESTLLKNEALKTINNYKELMQESFKKGELKYLYQFEKDILEEVFNDKQVKILDEYRKIKNPKIKNTYSTYITKNYENINVENLENISQILTRVETSNSNEIQKLGNQILEQSLNNENPLAYFTKTEEIFLKNKAPYIGKVFEIFKLMHTKKEDYKNYSPLLNRFKDSRNQVEIMDLIIFNDLLKCAFKSNNRNLKQFLKEIERGNNILTNIIKTKREIANLCDEERNTLNKYIDKIEVILDSYDEWKNKDKNIKDKDDLSIRIKNVINRLNIKEANYSQIPDMIIKKFCGVYGIDTFEKAKKYSKYIINKTNEENRNKANSTFTLEEKDFVKGINDIKYLNNILQNGSVSKEFLGNASDNDLTPLDTDLSRILKENTIGAEKTELGKILSKTLANGYGDIWLVLKNDPDKIEVTREETKTEDKKILSNKFSKLEAFRTLRDGHYGIRTGFASGDISYIISKRKDDRIGLEIAMNGFYIPVVNKEEQLIFTQQDYDNIREKMKGLSYYEEDKYYFSENLINKDTTLIKKQIQENRKNTIKKKELINSYIENSIKELGLTLKENIDGDLSKGVVELIDTGSTGRGTNKPNDGDFDFMMRLDKNILLDQSKLNKLKNNILKSFKKENTTEITSMGDFRLKQVKLNDETIVDIDITFTGKTDKISYSTDMCLKDRLQNIYKENKTYYDYVIANILLAKQVLKENEVYKPNRGQNKEGGLGGVGVENWILQNKGSFIDAAKEFLENAEGKTFEEFKNTYHIWDFGENHIAIDKKIYPHDDFVSNNMSEKGYKKMVEVLKEYLKKHSYEQEDIMLEKEEITTKINNSF